MVAGGYDDCEGDVLTRVRELVGDSLQSLRTRQFINPSYIDSLLDHGHREYASYYGVMIWVLVMLEQWLQSHGNSS